MSWSVIQVIGTGTVDAYGEKGDIGPPGFPGLKGEQGLKGMHFYFLFVFIYALYIFLNENIIEFLECFNGAI